MTSRSMNQNSESLKRPHKCSQFTFDKGSKGNKMEKRWSLNGTDDSHINKTNLHTNILWN